MKLLLIYTIICAGLYSCFDGTDKRQHANEPMECPSCEYPGSKAVDSIWYSKNGMLEIQ